MKRTQMKRGTKGLKTKRSLKRSRFVKKMGPVQRTRAEGNRLAREHYFKLHVIRPCQSCQEDLSLPYAQAHHKIQKGEEISNKLIVCGKCHLGFIHDQNHPEHRQAAMHSKANAEAGGLVDWGAYGLHQAFLAFRQGKPQPKGYLKPDNRRCQGCKGTLVEGVEVWTPCLLHLEDAHSPLFAEKP